MPRRIVEDRKSDWGRTLLVNDPHDFSNEDRWFVEAQLRFNFEDAARALFDLLDGYLQRAEEPGDDDERFYGATGVLANQFNQLCRGKPADVTLSALAGYLVRSWLCMEGREDESRDRLKAMIDDLWKYELTVHSEHPPGEPHRAG